MKRIAIGSDQNAYVLKEDLKAYLRELGFETVDFGCEGIDDGIDYPDVAIQVAESIARNEFERGILLCGTGIGMAITANKVPGVRAACCHDPYSAERARKSNDAQILTMGAQIIAPTLARIVLDHWLQSEFLGGRSTAKVNKINKLDESYRIKR
jgi:ribose 5-phosphate isomerase B